MNFINNKMKVRIIILLARKLIIPAILNTNTSECSATNITLWSVMTLAVIIGLVVGTFKLFGLI